MAKTAGQLRIEIEEYLNLRIRSKPAEDRSRREEKLLQMLENACEDLIDHEHAKQRQQASTLDSISDKMLADIVRSATAMQRLKRSISDAEEGE